MESIEYIVSPITVDLLKEYSKVSIEFEVHDILEDNIKDHGISGFELIEKSIESYKKNYDTAEHNPTKLMDKFDLSNWVMIYAKKDQNMIGGAIVAFDTHGIHMLEGRSDLAVLWDIRIDESYRRCGIGRTLISEVKKWSISKGCNRLKIETQNNNTKACKFYISQGARLTGMNKFCYEDYPEEIQLIWSITL